MKKRANSISKYKIRDNKVIHSKTSKKSIVKKKKVRVITKIRKDKIEKKILRSQERFIKVLSCKRGFIAKACRTADISRNTYYDWIKGYPEFAQRCDDIKESQIDYSECQLIKNIANGKEASLFFHLVNVTKNREHGIRYESIQKVEHTGLGPQKVINTNNLFVQMSKVDSKSGRKIGEILNATIEEEKALPAPDTKDT